MTNPIFNDPDKAREHLESILWADGRVCPHCGVLESSSPVRGKSHRPGLYYCNSCKKQFTVTVGTVFERSKVPLHKWVLAFHLMATSKKGISAHQLHRMLGVTYKTAWFMAHRIREAMRDDKSGGMGEGGGTVEVDETFIGKDENKPQRKRKEKRRAYHHMNSVLSLVDRNTGRARSVVVKDLTADSIFPILRTNIHREARLMTDEAKRYKRIGKEFARHESVQHGLGEYVRRGDWQIHTNTIEGFFSIFKRGMKGVYQHCGSQHLHRYLAEFDFRYSNRAALEINDSARRDIGLKGISGKRLTYQQPHKAAYA